MYRSLLYSIILFSAFVQAFVQPLIYLEYQLRKEYIVSELCKERYVTINTCDGRCFLVKKLSEAEQQKSDEKERNIKPVEIKLRLSEIEVLYQPIRSIVTEGEKGSYFFSPYSYLSDLSQDKPPQA